MKKSFSIEGKIFDIKNKQFICGELKIQDGKIHSITPKEKVKEQFILPGLVDAHIHIESSMLVPAEFAKAVVPHGTVGVVSDPHEIANVLGVQGVDFMIDNAKTVPLKIYFGAPSCVPATAFETAGAELNAEDVRQLLQRPEIHYLSEMMNYPGVVFGDKSVLEKLNAAKELNKPIDGHAPGLKDEALKTYIESGISTDHECATEEEAIEKIKHGMKIQIREGSAAKNFEALSGLLFKYPDQLMICSDDRHPDDLKKGHINLLMKRMLGKGMDIFDAYKIVVQNPKEHYKMDVGMLELGDAADFIIVDNLESFTILETYIQGEKVAENGKALFNTEISSSPNKFNVEKLKIEDLQLPAESELVKVIEIEDGQLLTTKSVGKATIKNGMLESNLEEDILKLMVVNRYEKSPPSFAFIHGFNLKKGAMGSSVAHDSHNIIALGTDDKSLLTVVNKLIDNKGGLFVNDGEKNIGLSLEVAGLMSNKSIEEISSQFATLEDKLYDIGCRLKAPFITLSFMALPVIPELKITDKGLFDVGKFAFTSLGE